jgi:hypothetical protein
VSAPITRARVLWWDLMGSGIPEVFIRAGLAITTPSVLLRMIDAGLLGRKTARGFHRYGE